MTESYLLEGTWSGYVSSQAHVVHREIVSAERAGRLSRLSQIVYTDGTTLDLSLLELEPGEATEDLIAGYADLIREAEASGDAVFRVVPKPFAKKTPSEVLADIERGKDYLADPGRVVAVVFENPGEIDLRAAVTFGVSVKASKTPIGHFGTGLKYALAVLLRTGHVVDVWSGLRQVTVSMSRELLRNEPFDVVYLDGERQSFTTQLGRDWEVWMAYRELHCNAVDEGGTTVAAVEGDAYDVAGPGQGGSTRIVVRGEGIAKAHADRDKFILTSKPLAKAAGVEVHPGPARGIFYRGLLVRPFKEGEVSELTYNVVDETLDLTEDRTLKHPWMADHYITTAIASLDDASLISRVIIADRDPNDGYGRSGGHYERGLSYDASLKPSAAFMAVAEEAKRSSNGKLASGVAYLHGINKKVEPPKEVPVTDADAAKIATALKFIKVAFGFDVEVKWKVVAVDTLPTPRGAEKATLSRIDEDKMTIFLAWALLQKGARDVAKAILREYVAVRFKVEPDSPAMTEAFLDLAVAAAEKASPVFL
jgi:hypothetical protein